MTEKDLKNTFNLLKKNFEQNFEQNDKKSIKIIGTISLIENDNTGKTSLFGINNTHEDERFDFSILISDRKSGEFAISINIRNQDKKSVIKLDNMIGELTLDRDEIIIYFKSYFMTEITLSLVIDETLVIDWSYPLSECNYSTYLHFGDDSLIDHDGCINHGNDHYYCKIYEII